MNETVAVERRLFLVALAALSGCQQQEPKFTEAMKEVRAKSPYLTDRCLEVMQWQGLDALDGDCTRRMPPTRWRGLWRNDFEGSLFCPSPAQKCANERPFEGRIWLEFDPRPASLRKALPGGLYAVEFVGRKSSHGSPLIGYEQDIVVDRMISIRQIEAPPPQPTAEEELASWKACLANRTCFPNAAGKARIKELEEATKKK